MSPGSRGERVSSTVSEATEDFQHGNGSILLKVPLPVPSDWSFIGLTSLNGKTSLGNFAHLWGQKFPCLREVGENEANDQSDGTGNGTFNNIRLAIEAGQADVDEGGSKSQFEGFKLAMTDVKTYVPLALE
jgi:hypothetical protein